MKKLIFFTTKVLGYAGILVFTSLLFKNTIYMDSSNNGMWFIIVALIVVILNSTIKPFLVWITIPITGVTLGLFYPFINLFILKIASLIVQDHFKIYGILYAVFASILISVLNVILDEIVLKKIEV